ncbi:MULTISPECIES: AEC family transporter [unclassified Oceanispirochaeta]|uniref:AEC family transporter n=1 Tax=unclassified Oceanispirochaeta TaxID=2635722 RepID=UPI001C12E18F|nr:MULTISPECIES: AEC family transporter [unclassified Oceanispirochaeta]
MINTILSILPVLLFFILGFILKQKNFLKAGSSADIKKIVSNLALPALLFQAFASIELEYRFLFLIILIFLLCTAMLFIGRLSAGILNIKSPYWTYMMGGFEMGMMGYALFLSIYGSEHLSKIALMDLGQVLFVFFVLMALLIREREGSSSAAELLKSFISSPVILAIFAGLLTSFLKTVITPNALTDSLGEFLKLLGNLTVPLISLMIGYELRFKKKGMALALKTIAVRKFFLLILALLMNRFFIRGFLNLDKIYEMALLTMFMLPPPFVISIYMKQEDRENLDYVNNTLSLSTVVSVVIIIGLAVVNA